MTKKLDTFWVKIYLAGDIDIIKQTCRVFCKKVGLCVTVTATTFIYTGGEEYGVEIGLINYPRFPVKNFDIVKKAFTLAALCRKDACQDSYLIMTPNQTIWDTTRKAK